MRALLVILLVGCASSMPPPQAPGDGGTPAPDLPIESALHLFTGKICSAVAIGPHEALTAKHCEATPASYLRQADGTLIHVESVQDHPHVDMTLLRTDQADPELYPLPGASSPPLPGSLVFYMGYGCMGVLETRPATYLGVDIFDGKLMFAGLLCPGDSGGAVVTPEGYLIGLAVSRESSGKPLFWAVASAHFEGL